MWDTSIHFCITLKQNNAHLQVHFIYLFPRKNHAISNLWTKNVVFKKNRRTYFSPQRTFSAKSRAVTLCALSRYKFIDDMYKLAWQSTSSKSFIRNLTSCLGRHAEKPHDTCITSRQTTHHQYVFLLHQLWCCLENPCWLLSKINSKSAIYPEGKRWCVLNFTASFFTLSMYPFLHSLDNLRSLNSKPGLLKNTKSTFFRSLG